MNLKWVKVGLMLLGRMIMSFATSLVLSAMLIANLVIPQQILVLPECCKDKLSSCCIQTQSEGEAVRSESCCHSKCIELRSAPSAQIQSLKDDVSILCISSVEIDFYFVIVAQPSLDTLQFTPLHAPPLHQLELRIQV